MKALIIGTDKKLFENGPVLDRHRLYAEKMEALYFVVFTLKKDDLLPTHIGNLHVYPTNSKNKLSYISDAFKISKEIILGADLKDFVVSSQDPFETGIVAYRLKKKFGIPLQVQIHTDFLSFYFKNSLLNILRVYIGKFILGKADGVRAVSKTIKDSININKTDVLPVYINKNEILEEKPRFDLKLKFPGYSYYILMASRLSQEKRIDVALRAFKEILNKVQNACLIIAGEGKEKNNLLSLSHELKLDNRVKFIGFQNDLISCYKTSDIFLLTSEYEGYGLVLVEAGLGGLPIVTTKVGIAKTDLFKDGENSFVCPVGDIDCLANRLSELLSDPEKQKLFKERMQDSIKNTLLSKEEYVERYVGLLEKLLK
jgi:glycosyltransferase involved in cell wall biosynthesis